MAEVGATAEVGSSCEGISRLLTEMHDAGDFSSSYSSGGGSSGFRDETPTSRRFQEYDAGEDEDAPRRSNSVRLGDRTTSPRQTTAASSVVTPPPPKQKEPEVDLLGMDDDAFASAPAPTSGSNKDLPAVVPAHSTTAGAHLAPLLVSTVVLMLCPVR